MALEAPMRTSTGSLQSFGHFIDMSGKPTSDRGKSPYKHLSSPPPSQGTDFLRPSSANRIPANPVASMLSPSDIVGPSPVTSNGTETTEIEDDVADDVVSPLVSDASSVVRPETLAVTTDLPDEIRQGNGESNSVIHAPENFANWPSANQPAPAETPEPLESARIHHASLAALNATPEPDRPPRPPISTDVNPVRYSLDSATPRAHTLQNMMEEGARLRSSSTSSLEKIEEQTEAESDDDQETDDAFPLLNPARKSPDNKSMLRDKLRHYWDTCAFLAKHPPTNHNFLVLTRSGTPSAYGRAWEACWKLCQRLYANQNKGGDAINVVDTLNLIRQFSQALFDVRVRVPGDDATDSFLRALYEAQNHLWNGQATSNPIQFHERSLDFYIAMCHRSMKLREGLPGDTEALIATCWSLAELLFSLRQCRRDGRTGVEEDELLDSACQACWDLCGLFQRNGNTVQTDRNTPRPSQTCFGTPPQVDQSGRESRTSNRSSRHSRRDTASTRSSRREPEERLVPPVVPETPVTDLEDTPISPGSRSPTMPNIMVLGPTSDHGGRWSSAASNMSSYSHSSNRTSSTATTTTATEDPNVTRGKMLILRAAMNTGFKRELMMDSKNGSANLQRYVKALTLGDFGASTSSESLLQQYKDAVLKDCFVPRSQFIPNRPKKYTALEMARVVQTLMNTSARYSYMRELYKFVFLFSLDDGLTERKKLVIEV